MKRAIKTVTGLGLLMALFVVCGSLATMQDRQTTNTSSADTIGNMSRAEFDRRNQEGAAAVAAVTATNAPLSKRDQKLMMDVATGGMMQLEISRVAVNKATNDEAKTLAQAEVDEQTGLSAKLSEIAAAKNVTLPSSPDSKTQAMVSKMQNMTAGADFDRNYVKESGVKGHEKLDKVMNDVESKATDSTLKSLAAAAHPLVRTHLQVSRAVLAKMTGNGMMNGNSMRMGNNSNSMMNRNSMNHNSNMMNSNSMMNGNSNMNMNMNMNSNMNMNGNSMMNGNSNSMMNNSNSTNRNSNSRRNRNTNSNSNMNSNSNSNSNQP